jgi:hypothetical protein
MYVEAGAFSLSWDRFSEPINQTFDNGLKDLLSNQVQVG